MPLPELATVKQVAAYLQVSPEYVRTELCGTGRVRAFKLKEKSRSPWRIDAASVRELGKERPRSTKRQAKRHEQEAIQAYIATHGREPESLDMLA